MMDLQANDKEQKMATSDYFPEVTQVVDPERFVLTLSREEADTLADILANVGGVGTETRRGLADNISKALAAAGANYRDIEDPTGDIAGSIYFLREDQRGTAQSRVERFWNGWRENPLDPPKREPLPEWERELLFGPDPEDDYIPRDSYCCEDCDGPRY